MKWGLKEGISIDADSGPPRYVLWCCGGICHEVLTFIQIGWGHTVGKRSKTQKKKLTAFSKTIFDSTQSELKNKSSFWPMQFQGTIIVNNKIIWSVNMSKPSNPFFGSSWIIPFRGCVIMVHLNQINSRFFKNHELYWSNLPQNLNLGGNLFQNLGFKSQSGKIKFFCPISFHFRILHKNWILTHKILFFIFFYQLNINKNRYI